MSFAQWMWMSVITAALLLATLVGVSMTQQSALFALSPLGVYAAIGGAVFVFAAIKGQRWAIAGLFVSAMIIFSISLRGSSAAAREADFDAVLAVKFATMLLAFLVGVGSLPALHKRALETPTILLMLYVTWAVVTAAGSTRPLFSVGAAFGLSAWIVFAIALHERLQLRDILLLVISVGAIFSIGSVAAYFFFPDYARYQSFGIVRLTGLAATSNGAAGAAALSLISVVAFYVSDLHRERLKPLMRWWIYLSATASVAVLIMAQGRAALIAVIVAAIAIVLQRLRLSWAALLIALLAALVGAIMFGVSPKTTEFVSEGASDLSRTGDASEIWSFAGRSPLWAFVVDRIGERPVTGYGYGAGAKIVAENYSTRWGDVTESAHNAFLQTTLDLGLVGGALLLAIFVWSFREFFRNPSPFRDGIFVTVFIISLVESAVSKPASLLTFLWLVSLFVPHHSAASRADYAAARPDYDEQMSTDE